MIPSILKHYSHSRVLMLLVSISSCAHGNFLSQNSRHDPYPMHSTRDPHNFLYMHDRLDMKGYDSDKKQAEKIGFGLSVWGQNSDSAKDFQKNTISPGNLDGKWSMVGLLLGFTPQGKTLPTSLSDAITALCPTETPPINDQSKIDPNKLCGFFDVQTKFKSRGFRFDWSVQIFNDFGLTIEGGVSDICYTVTCFDDLTCSAGVMCGCVDSMGSQSTVLVGEGCTKCERCAIKGNLTCKLKTIAKEIGLDICDFHKNFLEDFRAHLYWRHAYEVNYNRKGWPELLVMPFLVFSGSAATGTRKDPNKAFGLSSGNNDHNAVGFTSGLTLDFVDTIEIGAEAGFTHFFDKDFCNYRVPNSLCQSGIYPFTTDVCISPGHNWHFAATMNAHHFLERLSFYFQYVIVQHQKDTIKLKKCDDAFKPELLEKISDWKYQGANVGLNYDISPDISVGFLWQAPLQQQRVFRNTTIMFSFNANY